nr:immunoglobulin light chain junction region [Macaca mulatta]MOW69306.1 immunoglobulin light chain junction region [Macaca mulatta]
DYYCQVWDRRSDQYMF